MGRYDQGGGKQSGRYRQAREKRSTGVSSMLVVMLVLLAAAGGFYLAKFSDNYELTPELLALLPFAGDSDTGDTQDDLTGESATGLDEPVSNEATTADDSLEQLSQPEEVVILPVLDNSDAWIREALLELSPGLVQWLGKEQLIRVYMTIANDFSQGLRIGKHMRFLKPEQPFVAGHDELGFLIAAQSYQRYDTLAAAIDALDVRATLALYKKVRPLLLQAFTELGYPEDGNIDELFNKAAAEILEAPVFDGHIGLVKTATAYKFADPDLETASPLHKQMIRMGPENTRLIQNKVKLLAEGLAVSKTE